MRKASELDHEQLIDIVTSIQGFLYLERDERGVEYWEPDKQWSGADVCGHVAGLLDEHGLVPKRRLSYDGARCCGTDRMLLEASKDQPVCRTVASAPQTTGCDARGTVARTSPAR